jgi:hypothetical protein
MRFQATSFQTIVPVRGDGAVPHRPGGWDEPGQGDVQVGQQVPDRGELGEGVGAGRVARFPRDVLQDLASLLVAAQRLTR